MDFKLSLHEENNSIYKQFFKLVTYEKPWPYTLQSHAKSFPEIPQEFKESLRNFLGQSFIHDGVHGAAIISSFPGADNNEIGILRTFKDEKERDAFYNSEQFNRWETYASTLTEPAVYRQLTGLEAWFRSSTPPPRWKMAIATLCGVFPTSLFLYYVTGWLLKDLPAPFRLLITATLMVGILTWIVMPMVTKILKAWLTIRNPKYPNSDI